MPRAVELFCGIGGFTEVARELSLEVCVAIDIDRDAQSVYEANHAEMTCRTIESLSEQDAAEWQADFWWMSPPCQPYTRRGHQRGELDKRNLAFENIVRLVNRIQPPMLAMENVPGFACSSMRRRFVSQLSGDGYHIAEWILCPTQLGVPCRRRRYYLVASKTQLRELGQARSNSRTLAEFLSLQHDTECLVAESILKKYAQAIDVVDAANPSAIAACFTRAYGHSPIRSGSYLLQNGVVRRFSPEEILHLLGFRTDFKWPANLPTQRRWQLAGNSLSVFAVRKILETLFSSDKATISRNCG